jgi:hypothetical protein
MLTRADYRRLLSLRSTAFITEVEERLQAAAALPLILNRNLQEYGSSGKSRDEILAEAGLSAEIMEDVFAIEYVIAAAAIPLILVRIERHLNKREEPPEELLDLFEKCADKVGPYTPKEVRAGFRAILESFRNR